MKTFNIIFKLLNLQLFFEIKFSVDLPYDQARKQIVRQTTILEQNVLKKYMKLEIYYISRFVPQTIVLSLE